MPSFGLRARSHAPPRNSFVYKALPRRRRLWLSLALALIGTGAGADEPTIDAPPIVVEGTEPERPARDRVSAGETIRPSDAWSRWSVGELLGTLPGAQVRSSGGPGQREVLSLRGTDAQQALVLLDDVPLNTAVGGGVDLGLLPLDGLERVEIYRGGSAGLGGDAVGGALRLVTGAAPREPMWRLRAGGGSFGTGLLAATHAGTYGPLGIVAAAAWQHSEGAFAFEDGNGQGRTRANNRTDVGNGTVQLTGEVARGVELRVANHVRGATRGVPGLDQFPTPLASTEELGNVALAGARLRGTLAPELDLDLQAWHRFDAFRYVNPEPYLPPPVDSRHRVHGIGGHGELSWYWGEHQVVVVRLEGRGEIARIERQGAPVQEPSRASFAAVLSDEITVAGDLLTLLPMVRVDVSEDADPVVVPKLGVAVRPVGLLTLRANVGRAFRLPSFEELYYDAGGVQGNPDLSEEDALTFDAGFELDLGPLEATATYFRLHIENLIVFLPETAYLIRASDSKAALSQGVEASVKAAPLPGLTLEARYTFTDARFADTGQRLPARSPHQVGARAAGKVWRIGGFVDASWQAAMPLDRFGQLVEEERVMLAAGLEATVTDWLTLQIEGRNLTDKRDAVDALQQPLPGASVFAWAKVEL